MAALFVRSSAYLDLGRPLVCLSLCLPVPPSVHLFLGHSAVCLVPTSLPMSMQRAPLLLSVQSRRE